MQHIGQVSQEPVEHRMDWSLGPEMVIVVQNYNQLLIDALQDLIQKHINRAFRVLGQFAAVS
jgi:hypothetical protein